MVSTVPSLGCGVRSRIQNSLFQSVDLPQSGTLVVFPKEEEEEESPTPLLPRSGLDFSFASSFSGSGTLQTLTNPSFPLVTKNLHPARPPNCTDVTLKLGCARPENILRYGSASG